MRMAAACLAAVALLLVGSAVAQVPVDMPGYNCPASCNQERNCYCASNDVPGSLPASSIPQFVVFVSPGSARPWMSFRGLRPAAATVWADGGTAPPAPSRPMTMP